jgi:YD repeat-containing protein
MQGNLLRIGTLIAAFALPCEGALANETITYTYDELGRLVAVSTAGTVNNGQSVSTSFDPAGNRTNYTVGGAGAVFSIANVSVTEGGQLSFDVTRSGSTAQANAVAYASTNGTAIAPGDYGAASGTLSFAVGETVKTILVSTVDDALAEANEIMSISLSAPTNGAMLGTATGTGTINDNDLAQADLSIGGTSVTEGGTLSFTVTRSGNTAIAASASYASASGTAISPDDFTAASGTVSFAANETSKTISVITIDDAAVESAETLTVTLSAPSANTAITTATGTGTINDNDFVAGFSPVGSYGLTVGEHNVDTGFGVIVFRGYSDGLVYGSLTNNAMSGGYVISGTYTIGGTFIFGIANPLGVILPPNSGWTSISVPGLGTMLRSSMTYSSATNTDGTGYANWSIANAGTIQSGTVVIQ